MRPLFGLPSGSFCGSSTTDHDVGAVLNTFVLYISTFGPHW